MAEQNHSSVTGWDALRVLSSFRRWLDHDAERRSKLGDEKGADVVRAVRAQLENMIDKNLLASGPQDEPQQGSRRKAPDKFVTAFTRLIAEIAHRAGKARKEFDPNHMPGQKQDLRRLPANNKTRH